MGHSPSWKSISLEEEINMELPLTTAHYYRVALLNGLIDSKYVSDKIAMPDAKTRELKARLILEEAMETIDALGVDIYIREDDRPTTFDELELSVRNDRPYNKPPDLIEIADGCADLSVVTMGTLVACGIPDKPLLTIVDENNLAKFGPGSYRREDGKWMKPPNHKPPDIKGLLISLGWDGNA